MIACRRVCPIRVPYSKVPGTLITRRQFGTRRPGVTTGNGLRTFCTGNGTFSDLARQCHVGAEGDATDTSCVGVEPLWLRMPERTCSGVDLTTSMVFVATVFVRSVDVTAVLLVRFRAESTPLVASSCFSWIASVRQSRPFVAAPVDSPVGSRTVAGKRHCPQSLIVSL